MASKSNEYGFIPSSPTQAAGSNTGIFEVNDIIDLLAAGQWSLQDAGKLELIETKSLSGTYMDFDDLGSGYNTHLFIFNNVSINDNRDFNLRVKVGGVEQSGVADYARAFQLCRSDGTFSEDRDPDLDRLRIIPEIGVATGERLVGYMYMHNALDSSKNTFFTQQFSSITFNPYFRSSYGSGLYYQSNTLSGIRFYPNADSFNNGTISIYGLAES